MPVFPICQLASFLILSAPGNYFFAPDSSFHNVNPRIKTPPAACKAVSGSVEAGQAANVTTEGITSAENETVEMYVIDDWKNFRLMRNS